MWSFAVLDRFLTLYEQLVDLNHNRDATINEQSRDSLHSLSSCFKDGTRENSGSYFYRSDSVFSLPSDDDASTFNQFSSPASTTFPDERVLEDYVGTDLSRGTRKAINDSLNACLDALRLYSPQNCFIAFNGGKDITAALYIFLAALSQHYHSMHADNPDTPMQFPKPSAVFFRAPEEFPQVESFVHTCVQNNDIDLQVYDVDYISGCALHFKNQPSWHIAYIMGTRQSDLQNNPGLFQPSSSWMPPVMRISPIMNWQYGDVWKFLKFFRLPYCELYDQGYSSLGNLSNTFCNPYLTRGTNEDGVDYYLAANQLPECWWHRERAGRIVGKTNFMKENSPEGCNNKPKESDEDRLHRIAFQCIRYPLETHVTTPPNHASLFTFPTVFSCYQSPRAIEEFKNWRAVVAISRTAGLVLIGSEILKGYQMDLNQKVVTAALNSIGVELIRVVIVRDDQVEITEEIRRIASQCDVVITSGGIGPTHDDKTLLAVAKAYRQRFVVNSHMYELVKKAFNISRFSDFLPWQKRLVILPERCDLRFPNCTEGELVKDIWPILQCRNIILLPGVPSLFSSKMKTIRDSFFVPLRRKVLRRIGTCVPEILIADRLSEITWRYPEVNVGIYPRDSNTDVETIITVDAESRHTECMLQLLEEVKMIFEDDQILFFDNVASLSRISLSADDVPDD